MPVKLDLRKQTKVDEEVRRESATEPSSKPVARKNTAGRAKSRGQGRPKGAPAVTRSLRIRADINERLVKEQERTGLSFNELANRAFAEYLK